MGLRGIRDSLTEGQPYFASDKGEAYSAGLSPEEASPNHRGRGGPEDDEPTERPMWKETPPKGDENRCAKRFEARANIGLLRPTSSHSLMDTLKKEKGLHEKCYLFLLRSRQNVAKKTTK